MTTQRGLFRSETLTQALGLYLPATVVFRLVGFVRNVLLTWLIYDQAEFGLFALALVVVNLLNPLCSLGLNEAVTRYTPMYETRRMLRAFLARVIPLVCGVAALSAGLLLLTDDTVGPALFKSVSLDPRMTARMMGRSIGLMMHVVYATFTLVVYFLALCVLKGLRMFRVLSLMELVHGVLFTAMAIIAVMIGHPTVTAVVACYMMSMWIAMACFALPAALHLMLEPGQDEPLEGDPLIRRMFAFSLWAAVAAVMWQGMQNYPLWYLNRIHGSHAAGVFGAMRTISQYVVIAAVAVATVVMTAVTKVWESEGRQPADRLLSLAFKTTSLVLLTGCVVVAVLRGQVVIVFDPGYRVGAEVIPLLLMTFLIAGNLAFLAIHVNLIEKTRFLFWPWAIGLACNVLLGLWLIRGLAGDGADDSAIVKMGLAIRPALNCGALTGIGAAAWTGAISLLGALIACLILLRVERRPIDGGSYLLLAAPGILALKWYVMIPVLVATWLLAFTSTVVFTSEEKAVLAEKVRATRSRLRGGPGA